MMGMADWQDGWVFNRNIILLLINYLQRTTKQQTFSPFFDLALLLKTDYEGESEFLVFDKVEELESRLMIILQILINVITPTFALWTRTATNEATKPMLV